ncbi:FxsA family protein [Chromohalobacter nigrandesensis]|uniref:FxsA family protein n=1 Tax=Chromohalobacter nigrandesensis TaxID=119863 RepID=UPI001FF43A12|nr:FxsA family protein [Chromohalobacter nigrandesensis]MCK0745684.1 FxsA family protein [Chromohalobacter nigrandesensis]
MPLLLFITLFGLLDFVVLFAIGGQIGLLPTLALVLLSGALGLHLIRREGVQTLQRAQARFAQGEIPSDELITGAALIFGGALLVTPGFLSDGLGLLCLIPSSRRLLGRGLKRGGWRSRFFTMGASGTAQEKTADSDWHEHTRRTDKTSQDKTSQNSQANDEQPIEGDYIGKDDSRH